MIIKLKTGEAVATLDACQCLHRNDDPIHSASCFLFRNKQDKVKNTELLNDAQVLIDKRGGMADFATAEALLYRFAELEQHRLQALRQFMEWSGILEIDYGQSVTK